MPLLHSYTRNKPDFLLAMLALTFLWLALASCSDPLLPVLRETIIRTAFQQFSTGNQITFDLSVGVLSAIAMFYLLVRLPEYEKKIRIKRYLLLSYNSFKQSVIRIFVGSIQSSYDTEIIDRLMDQKTFREFFKEPYVPGQEKWHGVANKLDGFMLRQIVLEVEVLYGELQYALSIIDIKDTEIFSFMKRFSETLYRAKNWTSDYDDTKEVLGFFWQVLAGWSWAEGYTDKELIPYMISRL